jgi:hypothetical protein
MASQLNWHWCAPRDVMNSRPSFPVKASERQVKQFQRESIYKLHLRRLGGRYLGFSNSYDLT